MNRRSVLLELVSSLALLFGVGLTAIGVSGALAAGFGATFGKSFVSGDLPGATYTAERCEYLQQDQPRAPTCEAAATAHHFEEVVGFRLAAGLLGLLTLAGWLVVSYRQPQHRQARRLPDGFVATAGSAVFGVAALALLAPGILEIVFDRATGAGAYLSGGIVSFVVFVVFAVHLLRTIDRQPPSDDTRAGAMVANAE